MTCIVGLRHKGKVYMGGDAAATADDASYIHENPKVFQLKANFLVGYCGCFRVGQVLQYSFNPPRHTKNKTILEYLATDFVDSFIATCNAKPDLSKDKYFSFLVAYKGRLFEVAEDFHVAPYMGEYFAIGGGGQTALGSLFSSSHVKDPEARVRLALQAAEMYTASVRAPFTVLSL